MSKSRIYLSTGLSLAALALAASQAFAAGPHENVRDGHEPVPDAEGHIPQKIIHEPASWPTISPFGALGRVHNSAPPVGSTAPNTSPITYHGGPVMPTVSKVVLVWYGNWNQSNGTDTPAGQQIIRDALYGLANDSGAQTQGFNYSGVTTDLNALYNMGVYSPSTSGSGVAAVSRISAPTVECTQAASSTYGGTRLTDSGVLSLVRTAASSACSGGTPDAAAIYLVLSSSEISESSGFLTKYCGWHTYTNLSVGGVSRAIKYGFIGNPSRSISSCTYQTTASPNANPGVDAMVSVIAHELEETVSDPQLNAWYNAQGSENGDMCAWTFGANQQPAGNGSFYNVVLPAASGGSRKFLLQRALARANSACYINANPLAQ